MARLRPTKGHCFILPDSVGPQSDIIAIPEMAKNRDLPDRGRVVAMSGKPVTKKGIACDCEFKIGDYVAVKKFTGTLIEFQGVKYFSVPIHEVMAVL